MVRTANEARTKAAIHVWFGTVLLTLACGESGSALSRVARAPDDAGGGGAEAPRPMGSAAQSLLECDEGDARECVACQAEKCCDLLEICGRDSSCACLAECTGDRGLGEGMTCLGECGLELAPPEFGPLQQCMAAGCPDSDECSVPDGHVPLPLGPVEGSGSGVELSLGDLADCSFDDRAFDPLGDVLQLESRDQTVCLRLERRDDGAGSLANTEWVLLDVRVGSPGSVAHVSEPENLCWYSSHHNFLDWAHVWTGNRHHDLNLEEDGHGGPRSYWLHTFEAGPLNGDCAAVADGSRAVGDPLELFGVNP